MKLDGADKAFSKYIRKRDNYTCQRCKRRYTEDDNVGLQCSHFFGRVNENTRYDPDNCVALCYGCHKYFDETDRESYREFKIKQLGEKGFKNLTIRAKTYCKKDRALSLIYVKQLWKTLKK